MSFSHMQGLLNDLHQKYIGRQMVLNSPLNDLHDAH